MSDLLSPRELMALLGYKKSEFYRLQGEGAFEIFRTHPPIGHRIYSAAKVERWKQGDVLERPHARRFGQKKAS